MYLYKVSLTYFHHKMSLNGDNNFFWTLQIKWKIDIFNDFFKDYFRSSTNVLFVSFISLDLYIYVTTHDKYPITFHSNPQKGEWCVIFYVASVKNFNLIFGLDWVETDIFIILQKTKFRCPTNKIRRDL